MEVYLLETYYTECEQCQDIVLHVPGTDIWLIDVGYSEERIENALFTKRFRVSAALMDEDLLTYLGEL